MIHDMNSSNKRLANFLLRFSHVRFWKLTISARYYAYWHKHRVNFEEDTLVGLENCNVRRFSKLYFIILEILKPYAQSTEVVQTKKKYFRARQFNCDRVLCYYADDDVYTIHVIKNSSQFWHSNSTFSDMWLITNYLLKREDCRRERWMIVVWFFAESDLMVD